MVGDQTGWNNRECFDGVGEGQNELMSSISTHTHSTKYSVYDV